LCPFSNFNYSFIAGLLENVEKLIENPNLIISNTSRALFKHLYWILLSNFVHEAWGHAGADLGEIFEGGHKLRRIFKIPGPGGMGKVQTRILTVLG